MREFEFPSTIRMHDIWSTNCDPLTQRLCLRTVWSVRMVRKRQNHAPPGAASCSQQKSNKASCFMDSICSPDRTSKWEPPKRMQKIGNDFKISKLSPQSYCWKLENLYFSTTSVPSRSNRSGVAFIATGTKASSIGNPYSNLPFSSSLCTFLSLRLVCFMTKYTHTLTYTRANRNRFQAETHQPGRCADQATDLGYGRPGAVPDADDCLLPWCDGHTADVRRDEPGVFQQPVLLATEHSGGKRGLW